MKDFAARFIGFQETGDDSPPIALYNTLIDLPGHGIGSTVSFETLREAGVPWHRIPLPRVPEVLRLSPVTRKECGLAEPELSEEDQMREAYDLDDPKHPPESEVDPFQTPEYQAFVESMVPFCHCSERNRPCDGVLAGGLCDGINDDEDEMREAYEITDPKHPDYIDRCQWLLDTMEDR